MDLSKINCLSVRYDKISAVVACSVTVSSPLSLLSEGELQGNIICIGIWDTGATGSAITELTAQKLGIAPTGRKKVSGLGGTIEKNTYLIDLLLPNNVRIKDLIVTEIDNPVDENNKIVDGFGILIGMDVISKGDFCITNFEGKTVMTFRVPSMVRTDYVEEWNRRMTIQNKYKRK
jgi:Aspartyl protease